MVLDFAVTNGARFVFTSSPEAFGDQQNMPITSNSDSSSHQVLFINDIPTVPKLTSVNY